jgi:prevent-host-death family protein
MLTLTSVDAQNRFGQLLDTVQREPVSITRRGRAVAFVISPQEMEALQRARSLRGADTQRQHLQWASACAEGWNAVHAHIGSFADEHSTL